MIDIHAHILPGLDDGSDSPETSLMMAYAAVESGVTAIIATPHCNQRGLYENYASPELTGRLERLRGEIKAAGIPLEVYQGMEVFGTRDVPRLLREGKLLTLNGSRYLLIEFAFREDPLYMDRLVHAILEDGVIPIVAHPERYVLMSAPWYLDIQLGACLTAALLGVLLLAMWAVKRRMR